VPSATGKTAKPSKSELDGAVALIEALGAEWKPENYEDEYRKRLRKVVERKRKGKTIDVDEGDAKQPGPTPDLMEALKAALEDAKKQGSSSSSSKKQKAKA
jgi:DNA end-binding protein Ku